MTAIEPYGSIIAQAIEIDVQWAKHIDGPAMSITRLCLGPRVCMLPGCAAFAPTLVQ